MFAGHINIERVAVEECLLCEDYTVQKDIEDRFSSQISGEEKNGVDFPMALLSTSPKMQIRFLVNGDNGRKLHWCNVCAVTCKTEAHLRYHHYLHGGQNLFPCTKCELAFYRKFSLQSHQRCVHEKERNHKCKLCSSSFFYQKDLIKHFRAVHEKRRPFHCGCCNSSFAKKEHLTRHVRSVHQVA